MTQPFKPEHPATGTLIAWWHGLENNRADRAELRRCGSLLQVMQTQAFHVARSKLVAAGLTDREARNPRLAAIVALAAHVRTLDLQRSLPDAFSAGEKPPVSPLRFRQILEASDDDELFMRLRRVLPLIDGQANLKHLAETIWYWGDGVRKRWVYDYRWPATQTE